MVGYTKIGSLEVLCDLDGDVEDDATNSHLCKHIHPLVASYNFVLLQDLLI